MASQTSSSPPPSETTLLPPDPQAATHRHRIDTNLRAVDIGIAVITALVIVLRLWARSKATAGWGWDDWLIVVAGVIMFVNLAMNLVAIENGLGMHMSELDASELTMIAKIFYADEMIYIIAITLVKISILVMYCRIFALRSFRMQSYILGSITVLWSIIFIFACIFQCAPINKAWEQSIPGQCISLHVLFIGNAIPNIVTDAVILVMPIYQVWRLHVQFLQRATLTMIFLLGSFVVFSATHRLVSLLQFDQNNLSYTLTEPITWSHMEICVAIISACLPCMRPLVRSFRKPFGLESTQQQRNAHELTWNNTEDARRAAGFSKTSAHEASEPPTQPSSERRVSDVPSLRDVGELVDREEEGRETATRHHSIV